MKEEHIIPLSDRALDVLQQAKVLGGDGLIFPGMRPGRPMSDMTMSKLVKELGYPVDIHGFRTSSNLDSRTNGYRMKSLSEL